MLKNEEPKYMLRFVAMGCQVIFQNYFLDSQNLHLWSCFCGEALISEGNDVV